jgi:hypothetical protein
MGHQNLSNLLRNLLVMRPHRKTLNYLIVMRLFSKQHTNQFAKTLSNPSTFLQRVQPAQVFQLKLLI